LTKPPAVGQDLVDWLEHQFPACVPDEPTAERLIMEVCRKQGERRVLDHLRSLVSRQERDSLRTVL
jgi:hypothetical protein